jgi:hypothetical protein
MQQSGFDFQLWETWKAEHSPGVFIVPLADVVIFLLIVIPTAYILFNYTQQYFVERHWIFGKAYTWTILISTVILLLLIPFIPLMTK